jgi:hypothetical protein
MVAATEFEGALARAQTEVETAGKMANGVVRELRRARAAALVGQVRDLRRALDGAVEQARLLSDAVEAARASYDVDEAGLLESGQYAKELLAAAAEADVAMFEEDERLLCYPSIVRVLPGELALDVDRRRVRGLRPSVVVSHLQRAQQAGPRFKPEPFLASLFAGYELVVARQRKAAGAVVRLLDIYGVLTLLPGQSRDYTKPEFARDLYLLDQTGVTTVESTGRRLRWAASTGTKQAGVLSTVAKSGQQQRYWGVAFEDVSP